MCKENIYLFFLSLTIFIHPYCNAEGMNNRREFGRGYHEHGYEQYSQKDTLFTGNLSLKLTPSI